MKVDAKCEACGNLSSLNIPDDKANSGKNIDVQWKCKGCQNQNIFKLRTNNASSTVSDSKEASSPQQQNPQKQSRLQALGKYPICKAALCIILPVFQCLCIFCLINDEDGDAAAGIDPNEEQL